MLKSAHAPLVTAKELLLQAYPLDYEGWSLKGVIAYANLQAAQEGEPTERAA